jgi:uncharacterized membrane protein YidH (DUF202 family)
MDIETNKSLVARSGTTFVPSTVKFCLVLWQMKRRRNTAESDPIMHYYSWGHIIIIIIIIIIVIS